MVTTMSKGNEAEQQALAYLLSQGLKEVTRNYRVARGPNARGAEVDLIMRDADGTLVFVEVRSRHSTDQGGAAASVGSKKQRRCILGAQYFLMQWQQRHGSLPPCRFDVVAIDGGDLHWLRAAFDGSR